MKEIILKATSDEGIPLQATFLPEQGMNMISYKKGDIEVIDPSTKTLFEERFAGLGALIGPHFHRRKTETLPKIKDESLFPHIAHVKSKGVQDPFSHGIARYAPWNATADEGAFTATLSGKDKWNEVPLSELEGQNFNMQYKAQLTSSGLSLSLSVVSEFDSLVGIHFYYWLPKNTGKVISAIQSNYMDTEGLHPIPKEWNYSPQNEMSFPLSLEADYTFHPFPNPKEGKILLDAESYRLMTTYQCQSEENCWQLYHPKGASFVCIEPISSKDPRHPNLTVSSIGIQLQILK